MDTHLRNVEVYVGRELNSNFSYIDSENLEDDLTKLAITVLKKYGVPAKIGPMPARGGGIGEPTALLDAIKYAWEQKEIITFVYGSLRHIRQTFRNAYLRKAFKDNPTYSIMFTIGSSEKFEYPESEVNGIRSGLINLKRLADEIRSELNSKYPLLRFDESFQVHLPKYKAQVYLYMGYTYINKRNNLRLIRILSSLVIEPRTRTTYKFGKFNLVIKRIEKALPDSKNLLREHPAYDYMKGKTYYLLTSTRVISDYFARKLI